jgi:glycerol-3-phosphate dehydrogenase (NAD(P)+)
MMSKTQKNRNNPTIENKQPKVTVLGLGSWGTALSHQLANCVDNCFLWGRDSGVVEAINSKQQNPNYLSTLKLNSKVQATTSLIDAVSEAEIIVFSVPAASLREVAKVAKNHANKNAIIVNTAKGLEAETLKSMVTVLVEEFGKKENISTLSGPSFAVEVSQGLPTAVTVASSSLPTAEKVAEIFHSQNFRVYTSQDIIGVEFGGILKNVIALAVGILDGLNMGANARAALITRGLAEMQRLVEALGGDSMTVSGLSGLGDLLLTATSDLSRNRRVGLSLSKGESLETILKDLGQVAEGVHTAPIALALGKKLGVKVPIIEAVNQVLLGKCTPNEAAKALLSRSRTSES